MQQKSPSAKPSILPAPVAGPTTTANEIVTRPDPGVARGKWEAPQWAFWVALGVVVVGIALYVLRRMGILRLKRAPAETAPPPSLRNRR